MKMNDKKISILLGFILFFALCTPALASDPVVTAPAAPSILSEAGTVKEVNENQLTIETKNSSYPGQTGADKVVLLPATENPVTSVQVNGKPLNITTFTDHGNIMVPVRAVGEALGFTVTWHPADKSVSLDNGTVKTRVTLGQDSYYKASSKAIGLTAPFQYGSAPVVVGNRIYVPVRLFTLLYSNENAVTLSDGVLSIVSK